VPGSLLLPKQLLLRLALSLLRALRGMLPPQEALNKMTGKRRMEDEEGDETSGPQRDEERTTPQKRRQTMEEFLGEPATTGGAQSGSDVEDVSRALTPPQHVQPAEPAPARTNLREDKPPPALGDAPLSEEQTVGTSPPFDPAGVCTCSPHGSTASLDSHPCSLTSAGGALSSRLCWITSSRERASSSRGVSPERATPPH